MRVGSGKTRGYYCVHNCRSRAHSCGTIYFMQPRFLRMVWFTIIATLLATASHVFFGSVFAIEEDENNIVVIRDLITPSEQLHEISGFVAAPSNCHELSVRIGDFDADTVFLIFEFWEQPYRNDCIRRDIPRAFKTIAFAPASVQFRGLVDEVVVPMRVIREIKKK